MISIITVIQNANTALSLACRHGHGAVAELLIQKGANVHHQDKVHLMYTCVCASVYYIYSVAW